MPSIDKTIKKITFQRVLHLLLLCIFMAAFAFLGNLLKQEYFRPFEKVSVNGNYQFVNKNLLKNTIKQHADKGFFALDATELKQALENMPWVKAVKISRHWPGKLNVYIEEQKPQFYWKNKGYFNANGELFVVQKLIDVGRLPVIDCSQKMTKKAVEKFQKIDAQLRNNNIKIRQFFLDEAAGARLIISSSYSLNNTVDIQLLLGNEHHREKIQRFLLALSKGLKNKLANISSIDLRYSNGLAVAWHQQGTHSPELASTARSLIQ